MSISRRTALATGAAALVTGAITAPLAMKAAGVKAALASEDPQIGALIRQWREAHARIDDIGTRTRAALDLIPTAIREAQKANGRAGILRRDTLEAYNRHYKTSGARALDEESDTVCDRISDIEAQITQTPATTLHGTLSKARVAWHITAMDRGLDETDPDFDGKCCRLDDPVWIWSILQDLERLTRETRT